MPTTNSNDFRFSEGELSLKNLAIDKRNCVENCDDPNCRFSSSCLTESEVQLLNKSYQEHVRSGGMQRVFPSFLHYDDGFIEQLSDENQFLTKWFREKCRQDEQFC
jgi:hypothetical protein